MRYFILIIALSLIGWQSSKPLQGTYSHYFGKKTIKDAYKLLQVHYFNSSKIFFYLEAGKGAPSYDSGAMYGILTFNKNSGNYEYLPKDTANDCKLVFLKQRGKIIIKTVSGECPFGFGVFADGNYELKNNENPSYFISRTGKKVYFTKTTPENFSE
jgi:hypothetical protein